MSPDGSEKDQNRIGSEGFERNISENCMEYMLFLLDDSHSSTSVNLRSIEAIKREAIQRSQSLTENYIWQRDEFNLSLVNEAGLVYLRGRTDYGDAVGDEWLITYLLRELTISYPNLWARVADLDGEFLLIEAAQAIPNWLTPEMDSFRAWIHRGQLLLIPTSLASTQADGILNLDEAIQFMVKSPEQLIHLPDVEKEAFYRLKRYPAEISQSTHYALTVLPRKLAYVLHQLPKSVSAAVEAFYLRDAFEMDHISSEHTQLSFPPLDLVAIGVRFSKTLFAQLRSQRFEIPKRWQQILKDSTVSLPEASSTNIRQVATEDGMKLTLGYEILARTASKHKSRVVRELSIILEDQEEDGNEALPSDEEIRSWSIGQEADDDSWMDVAFEDLERELRGDHSESHNDGKGGFKDIKVQEDLRKIVSRFETFLSDDKADFDGARVDDRDFHDDSENESNAGGGGRLESEDEDIRINEDEFSRTIRELIGLNNGNYSPMTSTEQECEGGDAKTGTREQHLFGAEVEVKSIQHHSSELEAELKSHGALRLEAFQSDAASPVDENRLKLNRLSGCSSLNHADSHDEGLDIDLNLAQNILESFKSQGGMAGPTSNLLGLMGFQLPRDEDDHHTDGECNPSRTVDRSRFGTL